MENQTSSYSDFSQSNLLDNNLSTPIKVNWGRVPISVITQQNTKPLPSIEVIKLRPIRSQTNNKRGRCDCSWNTQPRMLPQRWSNAGPRTASPFPWEWGGGGKLNEIEYDDKEISYRTPSNVGRTCTVVRRTVAASRSIQYSKASYKPS